MNWFSNGFLGVYAEYLEKARLTPPESKSETLKELRLRRYEEMQAKAKAKTPDGQGRG